MSKLADLSKAVTDLISKPFSFDNKVELKTKAANGATFTSDVSIVEDGSAAAKITFGGKQGKFSVDKLVVGTDKKITGEFTFAEAAPGADLTFKFTDGTRASGGKTTAKIGGSYKNPDFGTYTVDVDALEGPVIDLSGLVNYQGVLAGASAKVTVGGKADPIALSSILLGYKTADYTVYASTPDLGGTVDLGLVQTASSTITAGFSASVSLKESKAPKLTLGGSYKVDSDATVFAAADATAKFSFAYKQKLNPSATITVNTQIDAQNLASDNHKFGLTLNLTN